MIYRWFGERWNSEGKELAVAIFVHDFLQTQRNREGVLLKKCRFAFETMILKL